MSQAVSKAVSIGGSASAPTLSPSPTNKEFTHTTGVFDFTNSTGVSIDYQVGTGTWFTVAARGKFTVTVTVDASASVTIGTKPAAIGPLGNITVTLKKSSVM